MGVDILILGAGWTSTFLIPLCTARSLTHAATTRSGRPGTLKFVFDPDPNPDSDLDLELESESEDIEPYKILPDAHTVLITFPIQKPGAAERLVRLYRWSRGEDSYSSAVGREFETGFILLGTTGIWDGARKTTTTPNTNTNTNHDPTKTKWYDRHTPPTSPTPRASAEIELLALSAPQTPTTVLNLAGLWGSSSSGGGGGGGGDGSGGRHPRNWIGRVAPTKEALRDKGSLHLLHGHDLALAILAVHTQFSKAAGQRWILTDGRVYDWWDVASGAWGGASGVARDSDNDKAKAKDNKAEASEDKPKQKQKQNGEKQGKEPGEVDSTPTPSPAPAPHAQWVRELMRERDVRALPRSVDMLGRALDSREFWEVFGLSPVRTLMVAGGSE